ncbi:spore cortex-lytic enzyme [Paenibacillus albiflavus]|uniref:Spore cortex-lytic enzyme n=1 Tax=Paenibacillus albiflavus TaxID=2545760 RepID=A0A4R4ENC3_9BACL|nr:spore cortex-lytic enzyme [Paenibacillus albiflavus]TCZ80021.1 spore cortex-lytic enzyme [Paenibacillus albiflavus]
MNKRLIVITLCAILLLFAGVQLKADLMTRETFSKNLVKYGSTGSDVREMQGRLKFLGYFHGKVDGIFGDKSLAGLKSFQKAFGMKVDGLLGPKSKLKLWEATKHWKPTAEEVQPQTPQATATKPNISPSGHKGYSKEDIQIMANAVYGEARGEPYEGQVAVAAVILNRVKSSSFPNTVHGVIFQPRAFTAVSDGQIYLTPNETATRAVHDAISGVDPTDGCEYYFNPKTATSPWIWTRPQYKTIGQHIFCR